jgi:NAD(P)-dependent dehydrogenase (short-subunit alcohol dehydrogenase family)
MKTRARGQPKLPRKHPTHMGRPQRCVLVIGGAGGVGSGIVEALLERGRFDRVLASSREAAKLETLRTYTSSHRRLTCISGSVDDRAAADALLAEAQDHGSLDAVVACLGGWWEGPHLTELDVAQWDCAFASLLRPHFIAARTFVPALTGANARYLFIGGDAALGPVPHSTLVSIAGAAQIMLVRALAAERRNEPCPIIEELIISGAVRTRAAHHGPMTEGEITAREAGDVAAAMLDDGSTGGWPYITRDGPLVRMHAEEKRR